MERRAETAVATLILLVACRAPTVVRPGAGTFAESPCADWGEGRGITPEERVRAVGFLDRLLRASVPEGIFLSADERAELVAAGELPVLFWSDITFAIPPGLESLKQSGGDFERLGEDAAQREKTIAYLEVRVDQPIRGGGYFFDRSLGHALPNGAVKGTRSKYCVVEHRTGWIRRRTVFEYWMEPLGASYHPAFLEEDASQAPPKT